MTDLKVVPVLLNRRHADPMDNGGNILILYPVQAIAPTLLAGAHVDEIVGIHKNDERILAWDICNEPFHTVPSSTIPDIEEAEYQWLARYTIRFMK